MRNHKTRVRRPDTFVDRGQLPLLDCHEIPHGLLYHPGLRAIQSGGDPAKLFSDIRDDYWSHHFTLGSKTQSRASELIGDNRAREIVANIVLPFVAAYAENDGDRKLHEVAKARYAGLPHQPPAHKRVTQLRQQLIPVG